MKIIASFFGADKARDYETFFLALAMEFGPKIAYEQPFADLARQLHIPCKTEEEFMRISNAYTQWYERNHPAGVQR